MTHPRAAITVGAGALSLTINGVALSPDDDTAVAAALSATPTDVNPVADGVLCGPAGEVSTGSVLPAGWSIAALLRAAGLDPQTTTSVTVTRRGGTVTLQPHSYDSSAPNYPWVDGSQQSLGYATAYVYPGHYQALNLFRPVHLPPCTGDQNSTSWVQPLPGQTLDISVVSGRTVTVDAAASTLTPASGQAVTLTASVPTAPQGETFTYTWTLSDGATATGSSATHSFIAPHGGTFTATVTATGSYGDGGTSPALTLTVGSNVGPTGGGSPSATGPPSTGRPSPSASRHPVTSPGPSIGATTTMATAPQPTSTSPRPTLKPTASPRPTATGSPIDGYVIDPAALQSGGPGAAPDAALGPNGTHTSAPLHLPDWLLVALAALVLAAAGALSESPRDRAPEVT